MGEARRRGRFESWLRQAAIGVLVRRCGFLLAPAAWVWRRLLVRTTFIAVTGSLGKTTAKECIAAALSSAGPTFRSYRNQNANVSIALNLLRVRPWHRFAVIETAAAAPGRMARPARLVGPDVAVILSVNRTHSTAYESLEQHAAEKAVLLDYVRPSGFALLNADDERVAALAGRSPAPVVLFGRAADCRYRATRVRSPWPGRLQFTFHAPSGTQAVRTQLVGEHWLPAALSALIAADRLGADPGAAARALAATPPFPGRLAPYRAPSGAVFLRDDYNAAVPSVDASFDVLRQARARRRILVITDLSDFEGNSKRRRRHVAARLPGVADAAVFVGENAEYGARRAIDAGLPEGDAHGFATLREAAEFLRGELGEGDLVLLKGRTTDHAARLFLAQFGEIGCWKPYCRKRMLCDICWEMKLPPERMRQIEPAPPPSAALS